ncbi:vacuolar protein sorting/targeting protein PEP1, partial [Rhizopus azygosporus]
TYTQTVSNHGFDKLPSKFFYFKDSEVVLWLDANSHTLYRSENQGKEWNQVEDIDKTATYLYEHPYDNDRAYVLSSGTTHWKTVDKGRTWQEFHTRSEPGSSSSHLSFHAERSGYILFSGVSCKFGSWLGIDCQTSISYTYDNFDTINPLRTHASSCIWSRSSAEFKSAPTSEIMCVQSASGKSTNGLSLPDDLQLVRSDDFFHTEKVVDFGLGREMTGVLAVSAVGRFIVAAVKPTSQTDMTLYVTHDGEHWHETIFPEGAALHEKSFTIIESSNPALLVDVLSGEDAQFGSLYKSNSNGTFFSKSLENTNRNSMGYIDIERIPGVEGILVANQILNPRLVESQSVQREVRTLISFDDGGSWNEITKVKDMNGNNMKCYDDKCTLNLHSVTSNRNFGQVTSSQSAVGVLMGVGNYGPYMLTYDECDTFLSTDGGISWKMVREGAHLYEFGDMGTLIVLVDDEKETDHVWWSKDRGNSWQKLGLGMTVRARMLTTDPESTSRKFLLIAGSVRSAVSKVQAFQLDFSNIFSRQCILDTHNEEKSDFERWYARDITEGPDCLMGHEQIFYRRKADRDCFVGREFQDPEVELKDCPCTRADYECDYNFVRDAEGKCIRVGPDRITADQCRSKDDTYAASSGYRLVPGNTCVQKDGARLDEPVTRKCSENIAGIIPSPNDLKPADEEIKHYQLFTGSEIEQFLYFRDSESILVRLQVGELWRSGNQGVDWVRVLDNEGVITNVVLHEFDNQRAYAILEDNIHYTDDQGKTWHPIKTPLAPSDRVAQTLDFHPTQKDWLLFIGKSSSPVPHNEVYVSTDHGRSWTALDFYVEKCIFGRDAEYKIEEDVVFCSAYDKKQVGNDLRLVRINFKQNQNRVYFDNIVEFFVVEDFMAVASSNNGELALHVSIDGTNFAEAQFPPDQHINRVTFTVLQSTTHAILLNVFKSIGFGKSFGSLYKSNENGTYYHLSLDNTNGDGTGYVDFEKFQSIDGTILANQVWNAEEVTSNPEKRKKVRTMISWDDGGSWQPLSPPHNFDCDMKECSLNLHGRTDIHGPGAIFSSSGAPGLAMGVGNVGPSLTEYTESDTFLTRDGGHTWTLIRQGEHLYEFGDQGSLLVLVSDEGPTNELLYSWDQGENWHTYQFAAEPIRVSTLTTDPKSSTLKFVLIGHQRQGSRFPVIVTVDFTATKQPQCILDKNNEERSDFERWMPKDDDGDDACLLGKKTAYWRRKKDRVCKVNAQFHEPEVIVENCECRETDFECDFGFWRSLRNECLPNGHHPDRPAQCKTGEKFKGRSGYKKNVKSSCRGGVNLEEDKEWDCGERGGIISSVTPFTDRFVDYIYFTDTDRVIVRTMDGKVWVSDNDGLSWRDQFPDHKIISMFQNPHSEQHAYFITEGTTHFKTTDKGANFDKMNVPVRPLLNLQGTIMNFHNDDADYLIYVGERGCNGGSGSDCHSEAFYSHDNGRNWDSLGTYIRSCIWGREGNITISHRNAVFCEQYREQSGNQMTLFGSPLQLVSSQNYFHDKKVLFENIVGVTVFSNYMVVAAAKNNGASLGLHISLDGNTFAAASFPSNFDLSPEAFTIMESVNSLWIHVTTNSQRGSEFGTIFTSNSNGTYYVDSLKNVNRNELGIVDFEKMQGIEGIAIANVVTNPGRASRGDRKMLSTYITADAGGHWHPIRAPKTDSEGKSYICSDDECVLNLHCYSERQNSRDLFSSSSAVGLMVGVGNVGGRLLDYRNGDMFLTRDAGKTWTEIAKGAHLWEFADQGSLLILVDNELPTNTLKYTTNEGMSWNTYEFTSKSDKVIIEDIITQPDGTSQKYVLLGLKNGKSVAYHVDFSPLRPNKCVLDEEHPNDDDFELWSPEDTRGEKCLFGREIAYYRRIRDHDCYIGEKLVQPREIVRNCQCTDEDYECDYNYIRDSNNKCVLVPGLSPLIPTCDGTRDYYYMPSGYRKIAASTCEGGKELDKLGEKVMCPRAKGSGGWLAFIFMPIIGAGIIFGVLHYRRRGGFGRIRLPDSTQQMGSNLLSHPILTKIVAAAFVIPVAIIGILSRIPIPRSFSDITDALGNIRLPFLTRRRNAGYSALGQDEQTDVLLEDYDGSEEHLIDEADELDDADEF